MGAYGYTPIKNLNTPRPVFSTPVALRTSIKPYQSGQNRPPIQGDIALTAGAFLIIPGGTSRTRIISTENIMPPQIQFSGAAISSVISQVDSRINDFTQVMSERVSEGKMPAPRFADLVDSLSDLRDKAKNHLVRGDFTAFAETADSIEGILLKSEFLSEMYADRLKLQVMRQTIDAACNSGIITDGDKQFLENILKKTVRENANALMTGDENRFMGSLMELLQITEATEIIRQGLDNYRTQAASKDLSAMNRTAREKILPSMKSANIINQELLERNRLIIEFAARFLQGLRSAQAEMLRGAGQQIKAIMETTNAAEEASEKQISELADTVQIIAKQVAISDINEATISEALWQEVWSKAPENALEEYGNTKAAIAEEEKRIVAILVSIMPKTEPGETDVPEPSTHQLSLASASEGKEPAQSTMNARSFVPNMVILKFLYALIEEQQEAGRKAAQKRAETIDEENRQARKKRKRRLEQKKFEANIAERRRIEKQLLQKLTGIEHFISLAIKRLESTKTGSWWETEGALLADEQGDAARTIFYYEQLATRERSRLAPIAA